MNKIHYFGTITCEAKTKNNLYVDFPAQIKKSMQRRFMCVCGGGGGGECGNIWSTVRDFGT